MLRSRAASWWGHGTRAVCPEEESLQSQGSRSLAPSSRWSVPGRGPGRAGCMVCACMVSAGTPRPPSLGLPPYHAQHCPRGSTVQPPHGRGGLAGTRGTARWRPGVCLLLERARPSAASAWFHCGFQAGSRAPSCLTFILMKKTLDWIKNTFTLFQEVSTFWLLF